MSGTKVDSLTFTAQLQYEGTWGELQAGKHETTMDLWLLPPVAATRSGFIEWDVPTLEETVEIGLKMETEFNTMTGTSYTMVLTDYDGVFSLPKQAIELLERNNIFVPEDFR